MWLLTKEQRAFNLQSERGVHLLVLPGPLSLSTITHG